MRRFALFMFAAVALMIGTPSTAHASAFASDSVKITVSCNAVAPSDTVYTVKCHNVVADSAIGNVGSFDVAMGRTATFAYARTVPPLTRVTVTVNAFGMNRSGVLSSTSVVATASAVSSDGVPVPPSPFTITVCIKAAGSSACP